MPRKKTTQKQKQKQKVTQKQQVTQKVVVQVDTRRRRKASTKRRPKQQAVAEQPMFVHPSLMSAPAPVPPAFFDPSAMEMNRRLQLLGDDLEVLKAQEASRVNQAVRPTAITGEMATQTEQLFLNPQPVNVPDRQVKTDMATSPIQSPRYAVEEKGKQKEVVNNIRENQQAYLAKFAEIQNRVGQKPIEVPIEPPVVDLSGEPEVVGEAPKRGRSRQPKQKPVEPFELRRSARQAEMKAAKEGLVNPIFGRQQSRVVIGQQPEEKIDL